MFNLNLITITCIHVAKVGQLCDRAPSSWHTVKRHHPHDHEDGSVSQNMPTLAKNQSDSNTNTWTFR